MRIVYTIIVLLSIQTTIAQSVGIGTTTPNPSARLEVKSTTQGILIPALTSAQRSAISNPARGLLVFQTDGTPGFYYYSGGNWVNLTNGYQANNQGVAVSSNYGLTFTFAAASFNYPTGVTVDISGNIYVADNFNHKIRKITPGGVVSTLAGDGLPDSDDGPGTAASFYEPSDVAVDVSGNVYVSDTRNRKIRKITAAGMVSTLAGDGSPGATDGPGATASFNSPAGIDVDASGNIYVADMTSHKIRKITPGGIVSTFAGNGIPGETDGAAATFELPWGVAVDASGNVYVGDFFNDKIRKITPGGAVSTLAGSGSEGSADGAGTTASFYRPAGVAVDASGNVYVADYLNNKIRKITPGGVVSTLAGNGSSGADEGTGTAASFNEPQCVAVDASGNVYVADAGNNKIRKIIAQ